ncbi:MAG TPA: tRNA (guanosine(37)-N1)-methyltransferase TrmD [Syntrophales bacterium]|nr:tRNA (guanosine(37)-N1)-methyltransferase TrmD [Syntrophales bacterium]HOL58804.1 tRNA (guanosine(37)-N1)-methyltransferase TrmD [Syntrophales bacterium]HPO35131.1 tRNA (guanosine(37)-N1)-methyltransferase TrmD [Syntrophales bacterium]
MAVLTFDILTIFPGMLESPLRESLLKKAQERDLVRIRVHDIRKYATDNQRTTDDYPYGGGGGMVMKVEPVDRALSALHLPPAAEIILMTPQGQRFDQEMARALALREHLVIICGHYEGVDERISEHLATREVSIGDYVLTGGELAALVLVDAVARLIPGVVGNPASVVEDSFSCGLLEYPQYTRPAEYRGWRVPEVLLTGHHEEIKRWRRRESLRRTLLRRPEMLKRAELSPEDISWLLSLGWIPEKDLPLP